MVLIKNAIVLALLFAFITSLPVRLYLTVVSREVPWPVPASDVVMTISMSLPATPGFVGSTVIVPEFANALELIPSDHASTSTATNNRFMAGFLSYHRW